MNEVSGTLMSRLRSETRELHSHAESRTLQRQIAAGTVDRSAFLAYLGQLYLVHATLETALARLREHHPSIEAVATPARMRMADLERDLEFHGVDRSALAPVPPTAAFIAHLAAAERTAPTALLGSLYVLEGSTNGGRFLARVLRKAWQLDGRGLDALDPYGDEQPVRWAEFKRDMDALQLPSGDAEGVVGAAIATFTAIAEISDRIAGVHDGHGQRD